MVPRPAAEAGSPPGLPPVRPAGAFEPLITAEEVYPVLEKLAWEARRSVWMAFRVFDPTTRIRSPDLPCESWTDLLREKVGQGVAVRIALADFDPVAAPELHQACWRSVFALAPLAEGGSLEVLPIRHEARVGAGLRYGLWLPATVALEKQRRELNELPEDERRELFAERPGIWRYLRLDRSGRLRWRGVRVPRFYPATHHQKIAVFDGEQAVIGGLDINERRWDTPHHDRPAAETWHDVSVLVDGPVVTDIARHLAGGWNENRARVANLCAKRMRRAPPGAPTLPPPASPLPMPKAPTETVAQGLALVRTISRNGHRPFGLSPVTRCTEIEDAYTRLIGSATRLIYAENQFLRSEPIAEALAAAARRTPGLGLILVLPAAPEQIAFDEKSGIPERLGEHLHAGCVRCVHEAFGERAAILTPVRPVASDSEGRDESWGAEIVYVHSKVIVVDDRAAMVSSANMNGRSLRWDQEAGVVCTVPERARELRLRLSRHWLPADAGPEHYDLDNAAPAWRRLAHANAGLAPQDRAGFLVPHDSDEAEAFGMSAPGVPDDLV